MPTEEVRERLTEILPAFIELETPDGGPLNASLLRQSRVASVFTIDLEELEAIAARIQELQEICRQNALTAEIEQLEAGEAA